MVSTPLKNISQIGSFPRVVMKIRKYLKPPPSFYPSSAPIISGKWMNMGVSPMLVSFHEKGSFSTAMIIIRERVNIANHDIFPCQSKGVHVIYQTQHEMLSCSTFPPQIWPSCIPGNTFVLLGHSGAKKNRKGLLSFLDFVLARLLI